MKVWRENIWELEYNYIYMSIWVYVKMLRKKSFVARLQRVLIWNMHRKWFVLNSVANVKVSDIAFSGYVTTKLFSLHIHSILFCIWYSVLFTTDFCSIVSLLVLCMLRNWLLWMGSITRRLQSWSSHLNNKWLRHVNSTMQHKLNWSCPICKNWLE